MVGERAYRLLKQEVKKGLGISLVKVLLRCVHHGRRDAEKAMRSWKRDVVLLLDRLMSGIGAPPLSRTVKEVVFEIVFSKDLLDGALLGREVTVRPIMVAVEDILPLCNEEVSAFWDRIYSYIRTRTKQRTVPCSFVITRIYQYRHF